MTQLFYLEDVPVKLSVLVLHPLSFRDEEVSLSYQPMFPVPHLLHFVRQIHNLVQLALATVLSRDLMNHQSH